MKFKRIKNIIAMLLAVLVVAQVPVEAATSFKGWTDSNKDNAWSAYVVTDWPKFENQLHLDTAQRSAKAVGISAKTRALEKLVRKIVTESTASSNHSKDNYVELMLAMIEVLSGGNPSSTDPCNVLKYMYPEMTDMTADKSIKLLFSRYLSCEAAMNARGGKAIIWENNDELKAVVEGVMLTSKYTKETESHSVKKATKFYETNKATFTTVPQLNFADQVSGFYKTINVASSYGSGSYKTAAEAFIACGNYYCSVLDKGVAKGQKWVYSNSNKYVKLNGSFDDMVNKKGGKPYRGANCAMISNWAFRDMGIMGNEDKFHCQSDGMHWSTTTKKKIKAVCEFKTYRGSGKTFSQLVKSGEIVPGDVILGSGHTYAYRGDGTVFACGHDAKWHKDSSIKTDDSRQAVFEKWIRKYEGTYDGKFKVYYVLHFKDSYVPAYYRDANGNLVRNEVSGGGVGSGQEYENANAMQKKVADMALQGSLYGTTGGQCQKWVSICYQKALGGARQSKCCANNAANAWVVSKTATNVPVGACVYTSGSGRGGCHKPWGHVGIYVGNGNVVSNVGSWKKQTLKSFIAGKTVYGWGWNGGRALA